MSNLFFNNMQVTSAVSISYPPKLTPLEYISFVICAFAPPQDKSVSTPHQAILLVKWSAFVTYLSNNSLNQSVSGSHGIFNTYQKTQWSSMSQWIFIYKWPSPVSGTRQPTTSADYWSSLYVSAPYHWFFTAFDTYWPSPVNNLRQPLAFVSLSLRQSWSSFINQWTSYIIGFRQPTSVIGLRQWANSISQWPSSVSWFPSALHLRQWLNLWAL